MSSIFTLAYDAYLVASKDLLIEWRSRSTTTQTIPFALIVLTLFGFALSSNRLTLQIATPGLFWMTLMFVSVFATQNSNSAETSDGARRMLLMSGMSPAATFIGKTCAVSCKLLAVELLLIPGVMLLYDAHILSWQMIFTTCICATTGLASAASLLGAVVSETQQRHTLLPILLLPVATPILIAATKAFDATLGIAAINGWAWVGLLVACTAINSTVGALIYGTVID